MSSTQEPSKTMYLSIVLFKSRLLPFPLPLPMFPDPGKLTCPGFWQAGFPSMGRWYLLSRFTSLKAAGTLCFSKHTCSFDLILGFCGLWRGFLGGLWDGRGHRAVVSAGLSCPPLVPKEERQDQREWKKGRGPVGQGELQGLGSGVKSACDQTSGKPPSPPARQYCWPQSGARAAWRALGASLSLPCQAVCCDSKGPLSSARKDPHAQAPSLQKTSCHGCPPRASGPLLFPRVWGVGRRNTGFARLLSAGGLGEGGCVSCRNQPTPTGVPTPVHPVWACI